MPSRTVISFVLRFLQFAIGASVLGLTAGITDILGINIKKVTLVTVIGVVTVLYTLFTLSGLQRKVPLFPILFLEIVLNYFWVIAFSLVADAFGDIDYHGAKWPKLAISTVPLTLVNWLLFVITNIIFISETLVPFVKVNAFAQTYKSTTRLQWGALYPAETFALPDIERNSDDLEHKDLTSGAPTE
ncbi:uncharacterized protein RJT21DRAFT_112797 [Scheffersomyces amazonensis]|uniref:uncharacterized protein n=1 Tax=Scheffersomyces amazonensis TaxID=1078765 RepID=UPI00315D9962